MPLSLDFRNGSTLLDPGTLGNPVMGIESTLTESSRLHLKSATGQQADGSAQTFENWHREKMPHIQSALENALPDPAAMPSRLHEAMRYAVLGAGKRLRPLLCHAAGAVFGAAPEALGMASAAVEMIHVASLVHDDLPALDNDDLRRGRATVHVQYDEALAILVGDALFAQAFTTLSRIPVKVDCVMRMVQELAHASGSAGLTGGQVLDLAAVNTTLDAASLEILHQLKTGSLIRASLHMGALCAGLTDYPSHALDRYAQAIGLAFQIVDDVLDCTMDTATLGKTAGKDARDHKQTYVSMHGLETSMQLARDLLVQAHHALLALPGNTGPLHGLAELIVQRTR